MLRSKRNLYGPHDDGKESKKLKPLHQAQRKFASIYPASPTKKEKVVPHGRPHKAEDFIEFLCVRDNTPVLPCELDVFMEPQHQQEMFSEDESDDELPLQTIRLARQLEKGTLKSTANNMNCKSSSVESDSTSGDSNTSTEKSSTNGDHKDTIVKNIRPANQTKPNQPKKDSVEIINVKCINIKLPEQKDFFKCISNLKSTHGTLALVSPPENIKVAGYVLSDIDLTVQTKHVHRLKHSLSANLVTSLAIIKQLEKESVPITELAKIGMCELDLPLLRDVVNSFGGVECVNRDQCWKSVADNLFIPKNASRRFQHIENIYLKYILPYETLPGDDKIKLKDSVSSSGADDLWPIVKLCNKKTNLTMFKKMADSYKSMYCKGTLSCGDVENQFWNTVSKGERHICGTSGEVDLFQQPRDYENSKLTVCWRLQNIFSQQPSALRYLGQTSKISVPVLLFEGVFSVSKWCTQEHSFTLISYLHQGDDKIWYAVPEESTKHFLQLKEEFENFVMPSELVSKGCQVTRCVQKEGQYVIIQPNCYYCTVATGYGVSEVVRVAPLSWFTSQNLLSFKPNLNEFVITKLILICSIEEYEKELKSPHCQFLAQKLDAIAKLMSTNVKRLNEVGIVTCKSLVAEEASSSTCCKCDCICYLVCVKSKNSVFCVHDACKLTKRKAEEAVIELVLSVERIQSLSTYYKTFVKKKLK